MDIKHSCFNTSKEQIASERIHVPIARNCTLQCCYCGYKADCNLSNSQSRPGCSPFVIDTREEILSYLQLKFNQFPNCKIIGVSGPGEPLENTTAIFELLALMKNYYHDKQLCICTNGSDSNAFRKVCDKSNGVLKYITVTMNSLKAIDAQRIYGKIFNSIQANQLINNQLQIIDEAKERDLKVKVNTIFLPHINEYSVEKMYEVLSGHHVDCFNLMCLKNTNIDDKEYLPRYYKIIEKLRNKGFPLLNRCHYCASNSCGKYNGIF